MLDRPVGLAKTYTPVTPAVPRLHKIDEIAARDTAKILSAFYEPLTEHKDLDVHAC